MNSQYLAAVRHVWRCTAVSSVTIKPRKLQRLVKRLAKIAAQAERLRNPAERGQN